MCPVSSHRLASTALPIRQVPLTALRRLTARLRDERGTVLVEFAIVLPVLLLIILGIIYFGRYEDYSNQETQLSEEGVRWAALNIIPSGTNLSTYIQSQAQPELQAGSSDVTKATVWIYQPTGATYKVGQPIRVCVATTVTFPSPIGSPTTTIAQVATMRIEQTMGSTLPAGIGTSTTGMPSQCPTP